MRNDRVLLLLGLTVAVLIIAGAVSTIRRGFSARFHDLRHTAVSRMIAARVPLPIIAKIVGAVSRNYGKDGSVLWSLWDGTTARGG